MILTPEQREVGRRNFLKASAALPAAGAFVFSRNQFGPVKCGVIGTGGEGRVLMENLDTDYIHVVAISDIRPDNASKGIEVGHDYYGVELDYYENYQEMLEKADIEAVIIATPLWMHARMAIAALEAGKHVFCEKTMAKSIDDCVEMNKLAEKKERVLQIGHQRFYSPIYWDMYRMVMGGDLGDVYTIRCQWHRNSNWSKARWWEDNEYLEMYPDMKDFNPQGWGYGAGDLPQEVTKDHLCNWRLYNKYSEGLMAELASHMLAITNWLGKDIDPDEAKDMTGDRMYVSAAAPSWVCGAGGTYKFKNGEEGSFAPNPTPYVRDIEDHVFATFTYPNDMTTCFSSVTTNAHSGYYEMIMGTKGTLILSNETNAYLFDEGSWKAFEEEETERKKAEAEAAENKLTGITSQPVKPSKPQKSASASRGADVSAGAAGVGVGGDSGYHWKFAYRDELKGFAETIRLGRNNLCDGTVGQYAAQAVLGGRRAIQGQTVIRFDDAGRPVDGEGKPVA